MLVLLGFSKDRSTLRRKNVILDHRICFYSATPISMSQARSGARSGFGSWRWAVSAFSLVASLSLVASSLGGSAQWLNNPINSDWNETINWNPATVPNTNTDVATFDSSLLLSVAVNVNGTQVEKVVFTAAAGSYTISAAPSASLSFLGNGIINNSGIQQNFATQVDTARHRGQIFFNNDAYPDNNVVFTNNGATASGGNGGSTIFANTSSAGSATFNNNGGTVSTAVGGSVQFSQSATAGSGTYHNFAGTVTGSKGAFTTFLNSSTAGSATLIANFGTGAGGMILFKNDSLGGTATVSLLGGASGGVGTLDISGHNPPGISLGSINGNRGVVFLGARNLTVGVDNSSPSFGGTIQDGGASGGTGGSLTKTGSGTLRLDKANTYTGPTTVNAGALSENTTGGLPDTSALIVNGATAIFNLSGTGSSHNDTVGTVTVDGGGSILGVGTSTLTSTGSFEMKSGSVGVALAGAGIALNKTTGGMVTLTGANTYTGGTTVSAGFLAIDNDGTTTHGTLGSGLTTTNGDSGSGFFGVLQFQHQATGGSGGFTNNGATSAGQGAFTEFFDSTSAGSATFTNNGTTVNGGFGGTTEFLNTSTASNSTLIANGGVGILGGGQVLFYQDSAGGNARVELFDNGQLDLTNHNSPGVTIGSIEGTGGNIALGANSLTVGASNLSTSFAGTIMDGGSGGSVTKVGSGSLTLSGSNNYAGATAINDGLLVLYGSLGTSAVTVTFPGELSGTGTINGPLLNNGIVDLTGGTLTINNSVTNNGLFILAHGAQLAGVTSFINNDKLDIMTAGTFTPPAGFVNNGVIIDSSVVKAKAISMTGNTVTVTIDSYTGHTYQLQSSSSPAANTFSNVASSSPQNGRSGTELTFTDSSAINTPGFYQIAVDP